MSGKLTEKRLKTNFLKTTLENKFSQKYVINPTNM